MITWERVPTLFSIIASDRVALCCFPSPEPLILKNMCCVSLALFYFHTTDRTLLPVLPPRVFPFFQHNKVLASLSMSVKRKQQESFLMTCASSVFSALGASTSWFQACRPWHLSPGCCGSHSHRGPDAGGSSSVSIQEGFMKALWTDVWP